MNQFKPRIVFVYKAVKEYLVFSKWNYALRATRNIAFSHQHCQQYTLINLTLKPDVPSNVFATTIWIWFQLNIAAHLWSLVIIFSDGIQESVFKDNPNEYSSLPYWYMSFNVIYLKEQIGNIYKLSLNCGISFSFS